MPQYNFDVTESDRFDKILTNNLRTIPEYKNLTRAQVKKIIEDGKAKIDKIVCQKAGTMLKTGQNIEIDVDFTEDKELTPYDFKLDILYEDEDILVINKPKDLVVHAGAGNKKQTLVNAVVAHLWGKIDSNLPIARLGIVHRLDKDTTGVMVIAKSVLALSNLAKQFKDRETEKIYHALALSTPRGNRDLNKSDAGTINIRIMRHPKKKTVMSVSKVDGRIAITHWKKLAEFNYGMYLELRIETGRTHQIRVHLNHVGSPVIGDKTYGDFSLLPIRLKQKADSFGRQMLHAYSLRIKHPRTEEEMHFVAPPPDDFQELLNDFKEYK